MSYEEHTAEPRTRMTQVCLVGKEDIALRGKLFSHEGARRALSPYEITEPWVNTVAVTTVSLGTAISFLNDLDWYLVRYARDAFVYEPSVSETEWLSRSLAGSIRDSAIEPEDTGELLKIYGVEDEHLIEPMYVQRRDGSVPTYDLRDVDETLLVRITRKEFGGP